MRSELFVLAGGLVAREEPFALATVVRRQPASSAQAGDGALITADGTFHGWLGGSCTQPTVVREALKAIADGAPRLIALAPDPGPRSVRAILVFPMTCHSGGSVDIYIEPVLPPAPPARLRSLAGRAGARAARQGDGLRGRRRRPGRRPRGVPAAGRERVWTDPGLRSRPRSRAAGLSPSWRRWASATRRRCARRCRSHPRTSAWSRAASASPRSRPPSSREASRGRRSRRSRARPASTSERARPRRSRSRSSRRSCACAARPPNRRRAGAARRASGRGGRCEGEERDPVCGMMVGFAGARHTAEFAGRTWYFCCGGCREKFLASPGAVSRSTAGAGRVRPEIRAIGEAMERQGYIAEPAIATALYLSTEMGKPLLSRATPAWGRPRSPRSWRACSAGRSIRLQCYEGLDVHTALYEWDYPRQMLRLRMAGEQGLDPESAEHVIFSREYLLERPLLQAITQKDGPAGPPHRRDRPRRRRLRGVSPRGAVGLPGLDPRARDDPGGAPPARPPDVQPDAGDRRRPAPPMPLPLHRAPELREGGPDHPGARARSERAAGRRDRPLPRSRCAGAAC